MGENIKDKNSILSFKVLITHVVGNIQRIPLKESETVYRTIWLCD